MLLKRLDKYDFFEKCLNRIHNAHMQNREIIANASLEVVSLRCKTSLYYHFSGQVLFAFLISN